jgi:hypothetical protein
MTKLDRAIEALSALPEGRREEVAELVLELTGAVQAVGGRSALTPPQLAEVRRRRADGFTPGDPDRIEQLLARLG